MHIRMGGFEDEFYHRLFWSISTRIGCKMGRAIFGFDLQLGAGFAASLRAKSYFERAQMVVRRSYSLYSAGIWFENFMFSQQFPRIIITQYSGKIFSNFKVTRQRATYGSEPLPRKTNGRREREERCRLRSP